MYISDLYEDELEISIKVIIKYTNHRISTGEFRVLIACHTTFQMKIANARIAWSVLN